MLDCSPIDLCRQRSHVESRTSWFGSHRAGHSLIGLRFVQQLQRRLGSGVGGAGGGYDDDDDDGDGDAAAVALRTRPEPGPGTLQGLLQYGEELCGALAVEKLYARPTLREFAHYLDHSGLDLTRLETGAGAEEERGTPDSAEKGEEEEEEIGMSSTEAMLCREAGACPLLSYSGVLVVLSIRSPLSAHSAQGARRVYLRRFQAPGTRRWWRRCWTRWKASRRRKVRGNRAQEKARG